jgi:hypothetical protein
MKSQPCLEQKKLLQKVPNIEDGSPNECQSEPIALGAPSRWMVCGHETFFHCIIS